MKKHELLKRETEKQNYSTADMATIVGTSRTTLWGYFSGKRTSIGANIIEKIETTLGLKLTKKKKD